MTSPGYNLRVRCRAFAIPLLILGAVGAGCGHRAPPRQASRLGPPDSIIPEGPLGAAIRRGRALLVATRDSLPGHVGNGLRCASCHLEEGRRPTGSLVGVYSRYPAYRPRSGIVETIEFRVNDCFRRSMNGTALDAASDDMRDIVAYVAFLSWGTASAAPQANTRLQKWAALTPDTAGGAVVYGSTCAKCHGPEGQGTPVAPPLWGDRSYNVGAGMARVRTAADFIRNNMPLDQPGALTDQQAMDVAAYVNAHPRPDYRGKELDWPNGDPPPDVAYATTAAQRKAHSAPGRSP